jgi:hypothetical protein
MHISLWFEAINSHPYLNTHNGDDDDHIREKHIDMRTRKKRIRRNQQ